MNVIRFVLFCFAVFILSACNSDSSENFMRLSEKCIKGNDHANALKFINKAILKDSLNFHYYEIRGMAKYG